MRSLASLAAFSLLLLASASASAQEQYIGAAQCGTCHVAQYEKWKTTGHSQALARLSERQQRDRGCTICHTMEPASSNPELAGVQCESCHGRGAEYAPRFVMKDRELSRLLGLTDVTEQTCRPCHTSDGPSMAPFDFESQKKAVCTTDEDASAAATAPAESKDTPDQG